jgi:hypothetical protein
MHNLRLPPRCRKHYALTNPYINLNEYYFFNVMMSGINL